MTLGKSINLALSDFKIFPPIDTAISRERSTTIPFARTDYDKPNSFTARLIEYRLQKDMPKIIALEPEGPFPKDFTKVDKLHQEALDYLNSLPAMYRPVNPNTSFDAECPWLPGQREYLQTVSWLFILLLHRPYLFSAAKSRTAIMKASIEILASQQRMLQHLRPNQGRMFALSFFSVEASVSALAVLIAFPRENHELLAEAFARVRETTVRLDTIRNMSGFAGPGADVIRILHCRAEKVHFRTLLKIGQGLSDAQGAFHQVRCV